MASLAIGIAMTLGVAECANAQQKPVTAIDIALEPDQMMVGRVEAANTAGRDDQHTRQIMCEANPMASLFKPFDEAALLRAIYNKVLRTLAFAALKGPLTKDYTPLAATGAPQKYE